MNNEGHKEPEYAGHTGEASEVHDGRINPRTYRYLQVLSALGGPVVLVALICTILGVDNRVNAEVSITVFLVSAVLLYASFLRKRVHTAIPAVLAVILGAVLIDMLLAPKPVSSENKWAAWESVVKQEVGECDIGDANCIAQAIYRHRDYPKSNSLLANQLLDDLQAGSVLRNIGPVKKLLEERVGLKDHFLGDGLAQPVDEARYWWAKVPEYLVKNHPQNHPDVWTWELNAVSSQLDRKLTDIIGSRQDLIREIKGRGNTEFESFWKTVGQNLNPDDDNPAVIRFARFPRDDKDGKRIYSGKMGRDEARRVFVLRLGPVYNLTLGQAAKLSGYSLDAKRSDRDKLWIWVYTPSDARDLDPPTWPHIISNVKNWLVE